ncbi:MAG: SUMF1/EgtB/PvdO family nonheme iron enzyme, partial [Planctomycetes bacterium]|nr:SUMF1/EgtB/PvdO family nonheme iron enzyme [Planctomycetota bacterium]
KDTTAPVKQFPPSPKLGLCDMIGNVVEWCRDRSASRGRYIVRGGSYLEGESACRIRERFDMGSATEDSGFRVCLEMPRSG